MTLYGASKRKIQSNKRMPVRHKMTWNLTKMGEFTEKKCLHFVEGYGILKDVVE